MLFRENMTTNVQRQFKQEEIREFFDPEIRYIDITWLGFLKVKCR